MDEIRIENLEIFAHHGVFMHEKINGQKFYVNAKLYGNFQDAAITEDLDKSTHYGEVCESIKEIMIKKAYPLIETVAEKIAQKLLSSYSNIEGIDVEVRKPNAPIDIPFQSVSVLCKRKWNHVILAIGSNIGNRKKQINEAYKKISTNSYFRKGEISSLYNTKPYGGVEQEDYVNAVIAIETTYEPFQLLEYLKKLEEEAERKETVRWGPRTLDLDIIFYNQLVLETKKLTIPHMDMENRQFVLEPLNEISPYLHHPLTGKSIKTMLNELEK